MSIFDGKDWKTLTKSEGKGEFITLDFERGYFYLSKDVQNHLGKNEEFSISINFTERQILFSKSTKQKPWKVKSRVSARGVFDLIAPKFAHYGAKMIKIASNEAEILFGFE